MKMGCSNYSSVLSNSNFKQRKLFRSDHRPRMLKDFLTDDSNSFSSNGFNSFPTNPCDSTIGDLIQNDLVIRSRSRAGSTTISAFHAMINAVKNVHFTTVKSSSILPRSISRSLFKNSSTCTDSENRVTETKLTVTIKDIIRWKSFRDLAEDKSPPLDLASSPHHCTTTTTGSTATTPCSSNGSSWCESDFTAEYLPSWNGNSEEYGGDNENEVGKKYLPRVGEEAVTTTYSAVGPKEEQKQQLSPIAVIGFKYEEDEEESSSYFDQSIFNVERRLEKNLVGHDPINLEKCMSMEDNDDDEEEEGIETNTSYEEEEEEENVDEVEEKAWQLWNHVKEISPVFDCKMVLDFFRDEISKSGYTIRNEESENEMISRVKAWIEGDNSLWIGWDKREAYVREMDKDGKWSNFDEKQQQMAKEIEDGLLGLLVDELVVDLIC